jgi:hypothetical protein
MNAKQWREYLRERKLDTYLIDHLLDDWESSTPSKPHEDSSSSTNQFFNPFLQGD